MTIEELQLNFDLNPESKTKILDNVARFCDSNYFFVDSETGYCYLFDEDGNLDDIKKIKTLYERYIRKDVKKIVIPDSVTRIGEWAFAGCSDLTSVTIGNGVMSIGHRVFSSCSGLTNVMIPDSVMSVGYHAFYGCSGLTSVTIPDSVTSIGDYAFSSCSGLTSVTIPDSVMSIWSYAFCNCSSLKSLIFKNKTIDRVKSMNNYPFGIENESIIRCEN